jgi:hypothetical protein
MPMVGTFTSLQLVRAIYRESTSTEDMMLDEWLKMDAAAFEEFQNLTDAYRALPKALFSAHPDSIQAVLEYSRRQA